MLSACCLRVSWRPCSHANVDQQAGHAAARPPQVRDVKDEYLQRIQQHINDHYVVGDTLKRQVRDNVLREVGNSTSSFSGVTTTWFACGRGWPYEMHPSTQDEHSAMGNREGSLCGSVQHTAAPPQQAALT